MKNYQIVVLLLFIAACGTTKISTNYAESAKLFSEQQNFEQAAENWKLYFNQKEIENIAGEEFALAANDALKANNVELANEWFNQARYKNYSSFEMYNALAEIFRNQNNISKELDALEFISKNFTEHAPQIYTRLFDVYYEIENNEKAFAIWSNLDNEAKSDENRMVRYFVMNKKLKNDLICDSLSNVILKNNPEQKDALEWNAKKYYWSGQNRYDREIEKYNKNKTTSQYKILLKELDLVTADFKKALPYLQTLWKINPGKEYASYLANIYARFGDEKKTSFYKKYLD